MSNTARLWRNPRATETILDYLTRSPGATTKQIVAATRLARRTVYAALVNLRRNTRVVSRPSLRDARQTHHYPASVVNTA